MLNFKLENKSSWEKIKESGLPVVVYGMGNGADKVIDEFEKLQIPVCGITASDDFVRGQKFRGFTVKKLSEFSGNFIVAVAFATCLPKVMKHIYSLKEKYRVIVPCVPVCGDEIFNREFVERNQDKINAAYELFDESSKKIFAGCVNFMFGGELETLNEITSEKDEVFESFFSLESNENYLDIGAYRGDTVEEFLHYCGRKYESIIAVEPDKKTFKKLSDYLKNVENSLALQKAAYSEIKTVNFSNKAGRQSSVSPFGAEIQTVTVDELCKERRISYIKIDVEGAENEVIDGGVDTLKRLKPKLNVALYHKSSDIFELPLKINAVNLKYKFFLRRHPYIPCWDMNLYCI